MRISDWNSDVCSADLLGFARPAAVARVHRQHGGNRAGAPRRRAFRGQRPADRPAAGLEPLRRQGRGPLDRKSVVEGKSVSVRVDLGARRIIKKKKYTNTIPIKSMHDNSTFNKQ